MKAYVDSSVILRIIFGEDNPLKFTKDLLYIVSSDVLKVECFRTIDRLRHHLRLSDKEIAERLELFHTAIRSIRFVRLDSEILERASQPFPTVIRTLDALHLSTAILWKHQEGEPITFLTHDQQLGQAAKAMGFEVLGCD